MIHTFARSSVLHQRVWCGVGVYFVDGIPWGLSSLVVQEVALHKHTEFTHATNPHTSIILLLKNHSGKQSTYILNFGKKRNDVDSIKTQTIRGFPSPSCKSTQVQVIHSTIWLKMPPVMTIQNKKDFSITE